MTGYEQIYSLKLLDDLVSNNFLRNLKGAVESEECPWHYRNYSSKYSDDFFVPNNYFFHFTHEIFLNNTVISPLYHAINFTDLIKNLGGKELIEAQVIFYLGSKEVIKHLPRIDYSVPNKCMILFLNSCNGGLEIANTKIEAIEGRAIIFNGNDVYNTFSCTNSKKFMFFKINYHEH